MTYELVKEILIDAEPEVIWPFLVDPDKHLEWEGTVAELDPVPGGTFRVLIAGEHQAAGEYLEVVPFERVSYTFGWEVEGHPIPPGSTQVAISLHPEGSKTLVRLVHSGLPDEQAVTDHGEGWGHYLGRLDTVVGGGTVHPDVTFEKAQELGYA